jgi:hypothetical protein
MGFWALSFVPYSNQQQKHNVSAIVNVSFLRWGDAKQLLVFLLVGLALLAEPTE